MALMLITYNVRADDTDYDDLFDAIQRLGETWHRGDKLESVWFLHTALPASQVSASLSTTFNDHDNWFVVEITNMQRQGWLPRAAWTWLDAHNS